MRYELYYWPGIQGRGEFIRLALEAAAADYRDVARESDAGMAALMWLLEDPDDARPPFAPPFLKAGRQIIAQTANILLYLGPRLELAPDSEPGRIWVHQLQLTIADFVAEIHDVHHPVAVGLYYNEQKREARQRARHFTTERLPKFLDYFERVWTNGPNGDYLFGRRLSYVDLSMFQVIAGLRYAFPANMEKLESDCPGLAGVHDRVAARPNIAAYLDSERRLPFSEHGVFRHYPELDH